MNYVVGQRWLSHAETQLGLGVVVDVDGRRITIHYPSVEEDRIYASTNAPLSRIIFNPGDSVSLDDGRQYVVREVNELRGLIIYMGENASGDILTFSESQLSATVQLTGPLQRLLTSPVDSNSAFQLRYDTFKHVANVLQSESVGLIGPRTNLLPHQIYIASQVAKRFAPRVLLADEVGLGKTIEAGLILHHQLQHGFAQRILIVLPPSLQHQWLVEMLRRFNLHFSLFNEERFNALLESESTNPFESAQLIICSIDWLTHSARARQYANDARWDLLIVDEAHHLYWSESEVSEEYTCVQELAQSSTGLILLTATPEQAGLESHFARLRLIDPSRFYDLEAFKQQVTHYAQLNHLVQMLNTDESLNPSLLKEFATLVDDQSLSLLDDKQALIDKLLDYYGTGRSVFRNTRSTIGGFPERDIHPVSLPLPAIYTAYTAELSPEKAYGDEDWVTHDPRISWLEKQLKLLKTAKVLVICANASTALSIEAYLQLRAGIRTTAFHEGMTLIERDRAAAWFADMEGGAQVLVCSEIGSEGRNFQFAQHLVLFDLPLNPDLLEQRIGRLDRIGQGPKIDIYIPYFANTAQETLYRWYNEGLDLFKRPLSAAYEIYQRFSDALNVQLSNPDSSLNLLIAETQQSVSDAREKLSQGRDALLELNSCNVEKASQLIKEIIDIEQSETLQSYMEKLWDHYGVDHEIHSERAVVARPSEQMLVTHFPELTEEGLTATFDRDKALARDDLTFLTWEHPMVQGAMEMLIGSEFGNATMASISIKGLPPGTLLLETFYSIHCAAPKHLQIQRYLSSEPLRIVVDRNGRNLDKALPIDKLSKQCKAIPRSNQPTIITQVRNDILSMHDFCDEQSKSYLPDLIKTAEQKIILAMDAEIDRLENLSRVNSLIRKEEIDFLYEKKKDSITALKSAVIQLQGIRLIINM